MEAENQKYCISKYGLVSQQYNQPAYPCSKPTMEIPKHCVKSVQS